MDYWALRALKRWVVHFLTRTHARIGVVMSLNVHAYNLTNG